MLTQIPEITTKVLYGDLFSEAEANHYYELATKLDWKREKIIVMGRQCTEGRDTWYCADKDITFKYSGKTRHTLTDETPDFIISIRDKIHEACHKHGGFLKNIKFNSCFANFYRDGTESLGDHRDTVRECDIVACVSLGSSRDFVLKENSIHRTVDNPKRIVHAVENGSLLIMGPKTQDEYKHGIPQRLRVKDGRISLTFRVL